MDPLQKTSTWIGVALLALTVLILPMVLGALWIKVLTSAAIFALAASGVALVYAQLGLINLAQIALIGVGGWIALRLNYATDLPVTLLVIIAGGLTGVIGALFALPALRMRGLYLALVTLMVAALAQIFFNAFQFPNGGEGFWGVAQKSADAVRRPGFAQSDTAYFRYVMIALGVAFMLIGLHKSSAPGRAWAMIRQSEANAMAAGINVTFFKLWAFALSGFLAGTSGALLAGALGQLDARSFLAGEGILLFALAVVGGVFSWLGAIVAGLLYKLLPAIFNDLGLSADIAMIIFGAALMHAIMTAPEGIAGQIMGAFKKGGSDD
ncbi:amino acid/amide ABC transporter membrane protein 2, HAAT family [Epibacterium ulvae]|uniref:Amino acid/amide ABC transporter membrane protein 2, HAAT family n=1 Tax=Epibacterium ulvae TaxID=1156985 RepID=A0A1G5QEC7_9RHOB|nr:branched-chain amino acid ABC transporter permease [Epibacterium ulvae]SCZ60245.1 amino acid/amide ABC transporter membrane protein 2, HAAT family [Epibacterium ulvae]